MPEGYISAALQRCAIVKCQRGHIYRFLVALPNEHDARLRYALPGRRVVLREQLRRYAKKYGWTVLDYEGIWK